MNKSAFVIGFLFALVGIVSITGSWAVYSVDTGIFERGTNTEGRLIDKSIVYSTDGDSDYLLVYTFTLPDGREMKVNRSVSKDLWSELNVGDSLKIYYKADNPARNFPEGGGNTSVSVAIFVSIIGALFLVFGILLLAGSFKTKPQA